MQKHIIDNKPVLMSNAEWQAYQDICKSYDNPPRVQGAQLFTGLFTSTDEGIITFIHPPSVRQTSMECFLFICALFQHQHMRIIEEEAHKLFDEFRTKSDKLFAEIKEQVAKTLSNSPIGDNSSSP
jgi:hypothetical protein